MMTDKQKNELRAKILLRVKAAIIGSQFKTKLENDLGFLDFNNPKSVKDFIANVDGLNPSLKLEIQKLLAYNEENQTQIFYFSNTNEEVMTKNVQVGAGKLGFSEEELAYFSNKNEIKRVMTNNNFAAQDKAIAIYNKQFVSGQFDDGSDRDLINILNEYKIGDVIGEEARGALFADLIKWKTGESVWSNERSNRYSGEFAAQNRAIDDFNSNFDGGSDGY